MGGTLSILKSLRLGAKPSAISSGEILRLLKPKYDPLSAQQLIPGLKPLSTKEAYSAADNALDQAIERLTLSTPTPSGGKDSFRIDPLSRRVTATPGPAPSISRGRRWEVNDSPPVRGEYELNLDPDARTRLRVDRSIRDTATEAHTADEIVRGLGIQPEFQKVLGRVAEYDDAFAAREAARRPLTLEDAAARQGGIDYARSRRSPTLAPDRAYSLEREIARLKMEQPIIGVTQDYTPRGYGNYLGMGDEARGSTAGHLPTEAPLEDQPALLAHRARQQQQASHARTAKKYLEWAKENLNAPPPQVPIPRWAKDLTASPIGVGVGETGLPHPADRAWWNRALGARSAEPYSGDLTAMAPDVVEAFYRGARDVPEAFTYGTRKDYQGARSLEDLADRFSAKSGERITVTGGEPDYDYWEPPMLKHSSGEHMKDEHGNYKGEYKTHEAGDAPMYDEYGDVKKKEIAGPTEDGEPLRIKRTAQGGEPWRDSRGEDKFIYEEARGGEPMRDHRGDVKYDDDAYPENDGAYTVSVPGKGGLTVSGYGSGADWGIDAMGGGKGKGSGELLYQLLLSDAVRTGDTIGSHSGLTPINQARMLANTNSNYARWGENPRYVGNAHSDSLPREITEPLGWGTEGPDIWRVEAAETKHRLRDNADRVTFDGVEFHIDGAPVPPKAIKDQLGSLSPNVESSGVGQKTLMRTAVFDWLRTATREEAETLGKNWGKIGAPLFGNADPRVLAAVASSLGGAGALYKIKQAKEAQK